MFYLGSIDHRMQGCRSLTKIGQTSMNQALMVLATNPNHFFTYIVGLFVNQALMTCLKNLIPCIPSPKISNVELS
ncbi:hypothetical protein IGI04_026138 [Brassica rapa subsp. trilocularis]|uniref:Uncharacterized protein n=1 Tax=Brassica rapa subsp. trilocularis TaxID=1813537 RepID=A0ABQ7KXQ6_BRACM|nr:hypothetical protein IGI04_026138 [Brassica rapa subsp. trilocularis]